MAREHHASRSQVDDVVKAAFKSGALNPKLTVEDAVRLGSGVEEVAGYVLAWERYVLVVARDLAAEVTFKR